MNYRPGQIAAALVIAGLLTFGLAYLGLSTAWGWERHVLRYGTFAVVGVAGLAALLASGRLRIAAAAVALGMVAFTQGVYGDGIFCNALGGYPPGHGFTYDWSDNALFLGQHRGSDYRCSGRPYRSLVALGYAVVAGGILWTLRETRPS